MPDDKIEVLTEIATDLILAELKRRAVAKGMTTEELIAEAKENWDTAESEVDVLLDRGNADCVDEDEP